MLQNKKEQIKTPAFLFNLPVSLKFAFAPRFEFDLGCLLHETNWSLTYPPRSYDNSPDSEKRRFSEAQGAFRTVQSMALAG
jgi:hypothetical protein